MARTVIEINFLMCTHIQYSCTWAVVVCHGVVPVVGEKMRNVDTGLSFFY